MIQTADRRYVFVMLGGVEATEARSYLQSSVEYPQSGLYVNDGSTTPLWTVDWAARDVLLPSDGIHLVRVGPSPVADDNNYESDAVTFFAYGRAVSSYRVRDLVDQPFLLPRTAFFQPHTVACYRWLSSIRYGPGTARLAEVPELPLALGPSIDTVGLTTLQGDTYKFGISSGQIEAQRRPGLFAFGSALLLFLAFYISYLAYAARKQRSLVRRPRVALSLLAGSVVLVALASYTNHLRDPEHFSFIREVWWRAVVGWPVQLVSRYLYTGLEDHDGYWVMASVVFWSTQLYLILVLTRLLARVLAPTILGNRVGERGRASTRRADQ
jgi:hypothetical protein